jgi:hypothetical protein
MENILRQNIQQRAPSCDKMALTAISGPTAYSLWKYSLVHCIKSEKHWVSFRFLASAGLVKGTEFLSETCKPTGEDCVTPV